MPAPLPMFAVFHAGHFGYFAGGTLLGAPTQPLDELHTVALTDEQLLRLRAIQQCGFHAEAQLHPTTGLRVVATTRRRPLLTRVGGVLMTDVFALDPAAAVERLLPLLGLPAEQVREHVLAGVRELLTAHPYPTRRHLVATFLALWPRTHVALRAALQQGLGEALAAAGIVHAGEVTAATLAQAQGGLLV